VQGTQSRASFLEGNNVRKGCFEVLTLFVIYENRGLAYLSNKMDSGIQHPSRFSYQILRMHPYTGEYCDCSTWILEEWFSCRPFGCILRR